MAVNVLLLEEGSLSYVLDESSFSILLESSTEPSAASSIFTYGFGTGSSIADVVTAGFSIPEDIGTSVASIVTYGLGNGAVLEQILVYGFELDSPPIDLSVASIVTYGLGNGAVLEKILVYGFDLPPLDAITGYLNHNIVSGDYFLYLENHDLILTEDDSRFYTLLLEVDYTRFERRSLRNMGVTATIGTVNTSASTITLSNLTCSSFMNRDNTNSGRLNVSSATLTSMYTASSSFQNNFGSVTATLSSMNGSILLGQLNDNFGFTADKKLSNLTISARASLIKPNYGSFYNYIY